MSNYKLNINSVLGDLELDNVSINLSDKVPVAYSLFEKYKSTPGLIMLKDDHFYGLLSRGKFFEVMSRQFMYDLYSKRKISHFFEEDNSQNQLILNSNTTIIEATNQALNRSETDIFEPVIVNCGNNEYRLLDFYHLLVAQNKIQLLMNELLQQANDFKKEVLAITAHDLRNPISAIMGFSDLMEDIDNMDEGRELASHIHKTAAQMNDLVNSFLMSTINDSLEFELEYSNFNINDLIVSVIKGCEHQAEKKKQQITFSMVNTPGKITSDMMKIKEVVENLLSNAIKYSKENRQIAVSLQENNQAVIIGISDQGPGFTEADLKKIFGKFQRLSARPTGNESSTGLGLYIVKKIVDKLNGTIHVESGKEKGSTFTVTLPLTFG